ncbi:hypothetical protein [Actinomycetospora flava]|uniref:Syndecan 1 n=1 Tax=Actinomycetospora flava TaxID=3129232 RepID=A0ABU8M919_9PSEU
MAERDMTGEDRPDLESPGLARRHAEDPPRIGRFGFGELGGLGGLGGFAGGGGDLANLPPWSVRDDGSGADGADGAERPDRDPVALAAWRRVAERRRRRASSEPTDPEGQAGSVDEPSDASLPVVPPTPPAEPMSQRVLAEQALAALERAALEDLGDDVPVVDESPSPSPDAVEPVAPRDDDAGVFAGIAAAAGGGNDRDTSTDDEGLEPWLGTRPVEAEARDAQAGPPGRPSGPPAARGGHDPRPGGGPSEPGGRHEVLLSLAGRIDDDALTSVRELVAVEDEAAAAELLGGCLLAAGAGVTAREHAVLGRWFAASRVDPELVDALPRDPEADRRDEHRFTADPPSASAATGGAGEAVARAAARLPGVQRVQQCWRTTPAGTAPGPVPHRVVLVETQSADDCEHVAHHVAHAAREHGAVSVEVFAAGADLPAYHRAAVRAARPLDSAPASSPAPPTTPAPPAFPASGPATPLRPRRPDPAPSWRRGAEEVSAFGAGDEVPPFGVPTPAASSPAASEPEAPADDAPRVESGDDEYRTVASAGRDPLERTSTPESRLPRRNAGDTDRPSPVTPPAPAPLPVTPPAASTPRDDAPSAPPVTPVPSAPPAPPEPAPEPEPPAEAVVPSEPTPVDIDPDVTAERIAALWRVPPPDEILSDQHPISAWSEGPVGPTFGPGEDEPVTTAQELSAVRGGEAPVDPDAATGDMPAVAPPSDPGPPDATAAEGRVRRARHSRAETGEFEMPVDLPPAPQPDLPDDPTTRAAPTNGHRHGPEADAEARDRSDDAATGPVERPEAMPPPSGPSEPSAPRPPASSGPDSFDVQLSERERELLARLHEELASRERLAPDSPDPLLGRPPATPPGPPPGSEDATAPRPRPGGPPPGPGRPGSWQGPPPGVAGTNGAGTNGHGPVNGHGLPHRRDHDDEDGPRA